MRTIFITASLVLALLTAADAAPLTLRCDGADQRTLTSQSPMSLMVTVEVITVKVEGWDPAQIFIYDEDVWSFAGGEHAPAGYLNRITGHADFSIPGGGPHFVGMCHKAERLF
jgi:hypothetical protein